MPKPAVSPTAALRWGALTALLGGAAATAAVAGTRAWALVAARDRIHSPGSTPAAEVAVVLGAGVLPDGTPSRYLAARLDRALELLRLGRVEVIVVSGADLPGADEPGVMRRYLEDNGVDPDLVVEDREGVDTYATCWRARRVYGLERIALVSQAYHLPRALAIAGAAGLDAVGVADWSVKRPLVGTDRNVWAYGVAREWVAGAKVLADLVRPRREDDPEHDPAVQRALAHARSR